MSEPRHNRKDPESIADLKLDPKNPRRRGQRAEALLVKSLQEVGAARSIVIDETGCILAGNGTVQAAAEVGIERVKVVDADGETIVAVRRTGLTEEQKRRLTLLDNRTAELAEWDIDLIKELATEGVDLTDIWNENELRLLTADLGQVDNPIEEWINMPAIAATPPRAIRSITVYFPTLEDVNLFAQTVNIQITERTKAIWFPKPPE